MPGFRRLTAGDRSPIRRRRPRRPPAVDPGTHAGPLCAPPWPANSPTSAGARGARHRARRRLPRLPGRTPCRKKTDAQAQATRPGRGGSPRRFPGPWPISSVNPSPGTRPRPTRGSSNASMSDSAARNRPIMAWPSTSASCTARVRRRTRLPWSCPRRPVPRQAPGRGLTRRPGHHPRSRRHPPRRQGPETGAGAGRRVRSPPTRPPRWPAPTWTICAAFGTPP